MSKNCQTPLTLLSILPPTFAKTNIVHLMVDKLLQSLKTKYAHLGLEENILKAIATRLVNAVKEESEIENAVKGVEDEVKLLQSVADKGRTSLTKAEEARKKLEKELEQERAKSNQNPQNPPVPSTEPKPDEVPEWAKRLEEVVNKQNETIAALQAEKEQQSAKERFLNQLKTQGVSETFYKRHLERTFKDDEEMNAFVNELKADEQAFLQTQANAGLSYHSKPIVGGRLKENEPSKEIQELFKRQ